MVPELIRASGGLVGEPVEIIDTLRERESAGLKEVTLLPPMASALTSARTRTMRRKGRLDRMRSPMLPPRSAL